MDLVAAGEAGLAAAAAQKQLRDEVAEKCQKLFQDFLEQWVTDSPVSKKGGGRWDQLYTTASFLGGRGVCFVSTSP